LHKCIHTVNFQNMKNMKYTFCRNLIQSTTCTLYYDYVTVSSFININCRAFLLKAFRKQQHSAICFPWAQELSANAIHSDMIQYNSDKSVSREQQYVLCARCLLIVKKLLLIQNHDDHRSQQSIFSYGLNVNLADTLKNETLVTDI